MTNIIVSKIKSFTDVITNSSSEVFVCRDIPDIKLNEYITCYKITWSWLRDNRYYSYVIEMIIKLAELPSDDELINSFKETIEYGDFTEVLYEPKDSQFNKFIDKFKKEIQKKIIDRELYLLKIEDIAIEEDIKIVNHLWTKSI